MLRQARDRLATATASLRNGNYPYAIRSAQECVELSLKSALRLVGVEYPKKHDVSRILLATKSRFPPWFNATEFAAISKQAFERRELAMYGDELRLITPESLFKKEEANEAVNSAKLVYSNCRKLLSFVSRAKK